MTGIRKCPTCGTPELDNAPLALVIYFATEQDRLDCIEAFKEVVPNAKAVPIDRVTGH